MVDAIHADHDNLMIIHRFGIPLGFGDKSVAEVCNSNGVCVLLFLSVCNKDLNIKDFQSHKTELIRQLLMFLRNSHNYYKTLFLPEIKNKIQRLSEKYPSGIQIALNTFFDQYEQEVLLHLHDEENNLFPYIEKILNDPSKVKKINPRKTKHHEDIEEKLSDLKNIIIKYMDMPQHDLFKIDLLDRLFHFQDDLNRHAQIEDQILTPLVLDA
ncbi:MAG: hemerythrin domain-containing protein [Paludibacteraceae bacterium]|nr:hemerythrin domain-containing protein [Paludibacteraceae bacterium]